MCWHKKEIDKVVAELKTSLQGLTSDEAQKRLSEHGHNELKENKKRTIFIITYSF